MSRLVPVCSCVCALALMACGHTRERGDTATAAAAMPAAGATATSAPTISVSQLEGIWHGKTMPASGDSVLATWTFTATSDTTKWVTQFTKGPRVPVHVVSVAGDSIVAQMGPYRSVSRKGEMVTARFVSRVRGDTLTGTYEVSPVAGGDSAEHGRIMGTRSR